MTTPEAREPGTIITFYSYKGGTGRSMALANVAWILASNGYRVLVVDWDLEAPGLHRYFAPFMIDPDLTESEGVIDIVNDYVAAALTKFHETGPTLGAGGALQKVQESRGVATAGGGIAGELDLRHLLQRLIAVLREVLSLRQDDNWVEPYANVLRYAASLDHSFAEYEKRKGWIDFIPAGRQGASYTTRMNSFSWQNFYDRFGGGGFIERIKERMKAEYDYVLIDSRTGVSDTSGICTVQLPDILAVCFTLNRQSIEGASAVAASVNAQRGEQRPVRIFPIPTRVEKAEKDKLEVSREIAKEAFGPLMPMSGADLDQYWGAVEVFYEPFYAYEEVLAVFGDKPLQTSSLLASMERIAGWVTDGKVKQLAPVDESARQTILAKYARQSRKPVGKGTQPGAREEYLFYVSYARADLDEHMERFIDDLSVRVRAHKGLPLSAPVGFIDYVALGASHTASAAIDTLQRSRVFVPLLSPALFEDDRAGRELHYFLGRGTPPPIVPIVWVQTTEMPAVVAKIQYTDPAFHDAYNSLGLNSVMRLRRYQDAYTQLVDMFAQRVVEASERSSLSEVPAMETTLPNAFAAVKAVEQPAAPDLPAWSSLRRLADSIPTMDRQAVIDVFESEIIPRLRQDVQAPALEDSLRLLQNLRRCRLYDLLERTANELIVAGQNAPGIRLLYAEALIVLGKTTAALAVLNSMETEQGSPERVQTNALLGMAYKNLYVKADAPHLPRNQQTLARAIKAYDEAYRSDPHQLWLGIENVALQMRAETDKVRLSVQVLDSPETMARGLLEQVEKHVSAGEARPRDYAVAAEACLALGHMNQVAKWIASYLQEPGLDAFEVSRFLSQLTDVWKLDRWGADEQMIVSILRAEILRREGGTVTIPPGGALELLMAGPETPELEQTFGAETFVSLAWYRTGLERSRAVGRVEDISGRPLGTAILVEARAFGLPERYCILTCTSVIEPSGRTPRCTVAFESLGRRIELGPAWFQSPPDVLDVSLFRVFESMGIVIPEMPEILPVSPRTDRLKRVFVIGYPGGGSLAFSMHDNTVLDVELPRIHYRAPTEPGSGGSPVFNEDWELVAIHHARSDRMRRLNGLPGTYEANEGIWIGAIREAVLADQKRA